jgi:CheY-like chemotaxis protein
MALRYEIKKNSIDWVVLLVDDTPDNLEIARIALQVRGATVHVCKESPKALALLETIQPDVILLDIRMPDMDGWKVLEQIRNHPKHKDLPVIAITAYAMEKDRQQILTGGFDGYISKPFSVLTIADEIRTWMNMANQKKTDELKVVIAK